MISIGNSYIDRYMAENLTVRSGHQESSVGDSSITREIVIEPKYDSKGRPIIDKT